MHEEINWLKQRIGENNARIYMIYVQLDSLKPLKGLVDTAKNELASIESLNIKLNQTWREEEGVISDLGWKIEKQNIVLEKMLLSDRKLEKLIDSVKIILGVDYVNPVNKKIVIHSQKKVIHAGDSILAEIDLCGLPDKVPNGTVKALINGKPVESIDGISQYYLPGDSTEIMTPGEYYWEGCIQFHWYGKDSMICFKEKYKILPSPCE